ncbi:hypothetical protein EYF80_004909 [Liparis tanakae]|uniref:Uncharacterized protein n=1 Tax=Liparis tanakae TaxID=230148 RepID=A0A4Z2J4P6_9TELE|nr:hypothetical protein EYF80_004909 [Liparis tanakae]
MHFLLVPAAAERRLLVIRSIFRDRGPAEDPLSTSVSWFPLRPSSQVPWGTLGGTWTKARDRQFTRSEDSQHRQWLGHLFSVRKRRQRKEGGKRKGFRDRRRGRRRRRRRKKKRKEGQNEGPQRSSLWSRTEDKECRLSLAVGTKPPASPSLVDPRCQLKKIKWSPSVFAVLLDN